MVKNRKNFDEKALRKKIREELEKNHKEQKEKAKTKDEQQIIDRNIQKDAEHSDYIRRYLKQMAEEKVYSKYPEFIKCENYLNEIRWLTLIELDDEHEFYPLAENKFSRLIKKIFEPKPPKIPDTPEIRNMMDEYSAKIEADAKHRIEKLIQKLKAVKKQSLSELESKIYQEEIDRFYSSKPGYKKYRNHLGEERWMTVEEQENQEEVYEEVLTPKQRWFRRIAVIAGILIIAASVWLMKSFYGHENGQKSFLIVELNEDRGHLYVDKNFEAGFKANNPYPIEAGLHEISIIRPGFVTIPRSHQIEVNKGDTICIAFDFVVQELSETAVVRIHAPYGDASIFADGEFHGTVGNQSILILPTGDHTLVLKKKGYTSIPQQHTFKLNSGDTIDVTFRMNRRKTRSEVESADLIVNVGLIEIHSNIKNADIYLDGHKTSLKTDYVLQKIPFGQHIISLSKKGYKIYPEEQVVRLSKNQKRASVDFTLSSLTRQVTIRTTPVKGVILINGKRVGTGSFTGSLPLGEHSIDFSDIDYYQKPKEQKFTITEDGTDRYIFKYTTNFYIKFTVDGVFPNSNLGYTNNGYILEGIVFKPSKQAGPEIHSNESVNENLWYLGYAFQYRNPPGNDALVFNFMIPDNVNLSETVKLKIWGYRTSSNYPLVVRGNSYYRIVINNSKFRNQVLPKFSEKEISESNYDEFTINEHLRRGHNRILISTTDKTTAHVALWKVGLE